MVSPDKIKYVLGIMSQFDLMMVLEYFDYSLALISLQFCIPPEDLLYIAVNQRHDHSEKPQFKEENLVRLKELNWPDFLSISPALLERRPVFLREPVCFTFEVLTFEFLLRKPVFGRLGQAASGWVKPDL